MIWEPYKVMAGLSHEGNGPTEGHYRAILFYLGMQFIIDDFALPVVTPRHEEFCRSLYLLWLVPQTASRSILALSIEAICTNNFRGHCR